MKTTLTKADIDFTRSLLAGEPLDETGRLLIEFDFLVQLLDAADALDAATDKIARTERALTPYLRHSSVCASTFKYDLAGPCNCGAVEDAVARAVEAAGGGT